jgi:hypothetical protein
MGNRRRAVVVVVVGDSEGEVDTPELLRKADTL